MAWVLVVDDDKSMRDAVGAIFTALQFEVRLASDGQEAWDVLQASDAKLPSLISSDYRMPRMNGVELLQKVRGNSKTEKIPFIMQSGDLMNIDRLRLTCRQLKAVYRSKTSRTPVEVYMQEAFDLCT